MTTSASDAPVTKSESVPISDETPGSANLVTPVTSNVSIGGDTGATAAAAASVTAVASTSGELPEHVAPDALGDGTGQDGEGQRKAPERAQLDTNPSGAMEGARPLGPNEPSVTKEEMERYMKISRDLKLRRGSLMPPGGTLQSGKNISASPSGVYGTANTGGGLGANKKKASLTMETHVELYGKGRIKLNFDAVSEEGTPGTGNAGGTTGGVVYQNVYPEDSTTSLVKRGGPSTAITPRRLSMEDKLAPPPPTPAPSMVSIKLPSTFQVKDDEHHE